MSFSNFLDRKTVKSIWFLLVDIYNIVNIVNFIYTIKCMSQKIINNNTNIANINNDFIILDENWWWFLLSDNNDFLGNLWFNTPAKKEESYWEDVKEELSTDTDIKEQISEATGYDIVRWNMDAVVIKAADKPKPQASPNYNKKAIVWNMEFGIGKHKLERSWISQNTYKSENSNNINKTIVVKTTNNSDKNELDTISDNFRKWWENATVIARAPVRQVATVTRPGSTQINRTWWWFVNNNFNRNNNRPWNKKPNSPNRPSIPKEGKASITLVRKEEVVLPENITVKEFGEKLGVSMGELIKKFISNKMLLTMNSVIDRDTSSLIAEEFGIKVLRDSSVSSMDDLVEWNLSNILAIDKSSETKEVRPPIVTIMWHVDHGKTTLLDYMRKTQITNKESWWITQSIWWSQIVYNNQKITFIDTPGHELFTSLRARWSKITDIIVIVVAADDGIMKQTIEAIHHAKDSWCPIIIAITKIDKWIDNSELIKSQLSEHELISEDRWWNIPIVKVSAKTWEWIEDLLENILLFSEVAELYCDPKRNWLWVVLESHKDVQKWVTTNMILMTGTLKVWDILWIHDTYGKVKKMHNRKWQEIKQAHGGDPIMVLGITNIPEAGKLAEVVTTEKIAKDRIIKATEIKPTESGIYNLTSKILEWQAVQLKLILKADSRWSLEALKQWLQWIEVPDNIEIRVIHNDIGNFYESDLDLGKVSQAVMLWFNTTISPEIKKKADNAWVIVRNFKIIYELTDYLNDLLKWMIVIEPVEVYYGQLKVMATFFRKGNEVIFGWQVIDGKIKNWCYFTIKRWEEEIWWWKVTSLQKEQQSVNEIWNWHECGMKAKCSHKLEIWDILTYHIME